jgi:hypothetical protein
MKNKILAIPIAVPAIPPKPNTPAINAMIKNVNAHPSMTISLIDVYVYNYSTIQDNEQTLVFLNLFFQLKKLIKMLDPIVAIYLTFANKEEKR